MSTEQERFGHRDAGEPPYGLSLGKTDSQTMGLLYKFLRKTRLALNGIPGGWKNTAAPTVTVGGVATPGTADASWLAANAQLVVATGTPAGLGNANAPGSSSAAPRLDHQHKRDVRVQAAGSDVGIRNAINFDASFAVTDNPGADRVDVALTLSAEDAAINAMFYAESIGD